MAQSSQLKKLGIVPGVRLDVVGAPSGWAFETEPESIPHTDGDADVILAFMRTIAEVVEGVPTLGARIRPAGALWIAWPRKAAGHASELGDSVLRDLVLPSGLVDTKVAAIDNDWSGLKFVWRRELR